MARVAKWSAASSSPEHRQAQLADERVAQFVKRDKQHVAGHDFDHVPLLLHGHLFHALVGAHFAHRILHPRASALRLG